MKKKILVIGAILIAFSSFANENNINPTNPTKTSSIYNAQQKYNAEGVYTIRYNDGNSFQTAMIGAGSTC